MLRNRDRRNIGRRRRIDVGRRRVDDVRRSGRPRHVGFLADVQTQLNAQGTWHKAQLESGCKTRQAASEPCALVGPWADDRALLPRLGASSRFRHQGSRSSVPSSGASSGSSPNGHASGARARHDDVRVEHWVEEVMRDTRAFFDAPATRDYQFDAADADAADRQAGTFRARWSRRIRRTTSSWRAGFPRRTKQPVDAARRAPRPRRRRAAAVELGCRGTCRPVASARAMRRLRAASQPALSRRAHAAGADARRLHRQLQHRADHPGVPAGGARRPARRRVAVAARASSASASSARASARASRC